MHPAKIFASALMVLGIAVSVSAAPPPGKGGGNGGGNGGGGDGEEQPPAAFVPEFAGIRLGGRNKPNELVLTNRDASAEVIAYSAGGIWMGVDLSIDTAGLIAFVVDDTLYLQSWSADDTFTLGEATAVYTNPYGLGPPDFSPDGGHIAFLEAGDGGAAVLNICDIAATELRCENMRPQTALLGWDLNQVRFHPEDDTKVVLAGSFPGVFGDGIFIHTLGSPGAPGLPLTQAVGGFDDVGPGNGSSPPLLVANDNGQALFYSLDSGGQVSPSFDGFGYEYRFNCSSDALLYLETGRGGPFIAVTEFGGPVEKLTNRGWNINRGHDWMPKSACS